MNIIRFTISAFMLFFMGETVSAADTVGQSDEHPAQARLIADVAAVQPGGSFTLGVLITMQPHWHVYWINPGDSGIPTSIRWLLPAGLQAEGVAFPIPKRFIQPGDLLGYGYEDEVLLSTQVQVSDDVPIGSTLVVGAAADWLVCRELCLPGGASLKLELPVKRETEPAGESILGRFDRWNEQLPIVWDGDPAQLSVEQRGPIVEGEAVPVKVQLDLGEPVNEVSVYPAPPEQLAVEVVEMVGSGERVDLTLAVRQLYGEVPEQLRVLVVDENADGLRHGWEVSLALH
jgi:DsbC/DsbD-like thiol-disulfide interchange protein